MINVRIAIETIRKIDAMVKADQGAAYRGWLGKVIGHIGDAYRTDEDGHRSHMGASQLGHECARAIWYNFRWATKSNFDGRMIRLFNRGHLEEARFIALMLMLGCQVFQQDETGAQYRISFADGHAGGSGDGVLLGLPDLPPDSYVLAEFKTHSEKSFIEVAGKLEDWRAFVAGKGPFTGKGIREAKTEYFVQCQLYMRKMGLAACAHFNICKNTDDIYAEIILLDSELADQFAARGEKLVWMEEPPAKINASPGFFKCRFCDHKPVCHLKAAPDRNCRTCVYSVPVAAGEWHCRLLNTKLDKAMQLRGCGEYVVQKHYG